MKVLLWYRCHRQKEEMRIAATFLNRTSFLKECDLIFHCNNMNISIDYNFSLFPNPTKKLIQTPVNAGYMRGCLQALSNNFNLFSEYDYVIHIQTDVFVLNESKIVEILEKYKNRKEVFISTKQRPDDDTYLAFDFFIFKPKLLKKNIFKLWEDSEFTKQTKQFYSYPTLEHNMTPEHVLYKAIYTHSIPYVLLKRYDTDNWMPRRVDLLNLWHEHDLEKVYKYMSGSNISLL